MAENSPRRRTLRALLALAPALALAGLPLWWPQPLAALGPWLAQPAFGLASGWWHGTRVGPDPTPRWGRDGLALALLWLAAGVGLAVLVAWPLTALRDTGTLGAALGLSVLAGFGLLGLWRTWPMFGRAVREGGGFARLAAALGEGDPADRRGLVLAVALFAVLAGVLALAWPGLLPTAGLRWPLALVTLVSSLLTAVLLGRYGYPPRPALAAADAEDEAGAEPDAHDFDEDDFDERDPDERLYAAARNGKVDAALQALADGADPQALPVAGERDQRTLPMLAAVLADLRLLRELIRRGADLNLRHGELTPLLATTRDSWHGRTEAVMTLLANGADPRQTDAEGNTSLHHAARSSDPGVAALLLDAGAPVDVLNGEGLSPLAVACASGNWRLARFLLERGATAEPADGQPALLAAASGEDDPAGVQLLLRHKARVDARGAQHRTALMVACAAGNAEIVAVLLEAGADPNARDAHGLTPLLEAARSGGEAVLLRLAVAHPDPAAADEPGRNALALAGENRSAGPALVRRLLELGVDPRQPDRAGRRPAEHAAAAGRWRLVRAIDPAYPLPATVAEDLASGPRERTPRELLRDALAERRFESAEAMQRLGAGPEPEASAALLLEFAGEDDADAFAWLLAHGAEPDRRIAGGDSALFHLLDRGGAALGPLTRLLEHGAAPGGRGGLARYLAACAGGEHHARGFEQLALALLERGADAFGTDAEGETPLALAIKLGWLRLAEALLARGANPQAGDARGQGALHLACALGREAAVRLLVRYGAAPEARAADGQTPLGLALASGRRELAAWLEWRGWRLPGRPLQPSDVPAAAIVGDVEAVRRLIELGLPVDAVDAQGCTALLRAAGGGHLPVVELLLGHGADPAIAARTGATPLSAAVSMRQTEIVERLLAHGAAVDQALPGEVTPLMLAAALGLPELAARLLKRGADVHARDAQGLGALHCAALYAFAARDVQRVLALFDTLLFAGAEADAPNASGQTPLLLLLGARAEPGTACDEEVLLAGLERLLQEEVALDSQDPRGFAPLHLAALHGLARVVQRLLREGADRNQRDTLNRTPHDIAVLRGFVDVAAEFGSARNAPSSLAGFLKNRD